MEVSHSVLYRLACVPLSATMPVILAQKRPIPGVNVSAAWQPERTTPLLHAAPVLGVDLGRLGNAWAPSECCHWLYHGSC